MLLFESDVLWNNNTKSKL